MTNLAGIARQRSTATAADRVYAAAARIVFPTVWWALRLAGGGTAADQQRRGFLPSSGGPAVWLHGASAGEMSAAFRLVELLRNDGCDFEAVFTTTNRAGLEYARRAARSDDVCCLAPWDAPAWIARAFDRLRPEILVLIETEMWPRLILEACRRDVPVLYASARIYDDDFNGYRLARPWIAPMLGRVACVAAQDEVQRERFVRLGAPARRCHAAGNLKHLPGASRGGTLDLGFPAARRLVVAGSLRGGEVELVLGAFERVAADPSLCLVAAPRQRDTVEIIERLARRHGWPTARRSQTGTSPWRVLILDTMGELPAFYARAAVAIVGGGFADYGGHNPFEPLQAGVPVLFGPNMRHFASESMALTAVLPEAQVSGTDALGEQLARWLSDESSRTSALAAQRSVLPDPSVLGQRYRDLLSPWFERFGAKPESPPIL